MLCCVGDLVEDVVVWLAGPVRRGADAPATVWAGAGGSARNVAAFAVRAGAPARFVGQVGDDDLGERLLVDLERIGVDVAVVRGGRTGRIVVVVDPDGERSFLTDRGAAPELAEVDPAWLADVDVVHLPAYSLSPSTPLGATARHLAALAAGGGTLISVDASSCTALDALGPDPLAALAGLRPDVLLANGDEASSLGLVGEPPVGVGVVVVRAGAEPTTVLRRGAPPLVVPVPPVDEVLDTTGAGDAFAAGFLPSWAAGHPIEDAVAAGHALAARVLTTPGARLEGAR